MNELPTFISQHSVLENLVFLPLILVFTFMGGFLGSYIRKRGENFATKSDFDSLLSQLKSTTEATENIKSMITEKSWNNQQKWLLKDKYYSQILEALHVLKSSLSDRLDHFIYPDSVYHEKEIAEEDSYRINEQKGVDAIGSIEKLKGPASIYLSSKTIQALTSLDITSWEAKMGSANTEELLQSIYDKVCDTYNAILKEARGELR